MKVKEPKRKILTPTTDRYIRGFPKIDHSGIDAGLYSSKINSAKKFPLAGIELSTLGL